MTLIKERIREALNVRGMTAAELSRLSGIDKGSVSRYLKGDIIPKQSKIDALARALGVSPAWLLGFNVSMSGDALPPVIDFDKLSEVNRSRLLAYYQALIDSQGGGV